MIYLCGFARDVFDLNVFDFELFQNHQPKASIMYDIEDRIKGSFFGLVVGDALGAPLEGAKPGAIKSAYKVVRDYVDREAILGREKIYRWRKPGLYTDDTQQALVLLDSLLQDRGLHPAKLAERFVELSNGSEYSFGAYRGAGRNFKQSVEDLKRGVEWSRSGRDTAGNGAAMRIAPIALYYYENLDEMADAAVRASLITHRNPLGISAAVGVAYIVARCLREQEPEAALAKTIISDAAGFCRKSELMLKERYAVHFYYDYEKQLHIFSAALEELAARFGDDPEKVCGWIAKNADRHTTAPIARPTMGFALASVVYSIYIAMKHIDSFEEAVVTAVNSGGDADTIGAMTGAMSGAMHGAAAIPERWLSPLANRKQLKARAEAMATKTWPKKKMESLYEMEYSITGREHAERLSRMRKAGVEFPEPNRDKLSAPIPIKEKFDAKKFRKELKKMKNREE